jgi:hypothetical protein
MVAPRKTAVRPAQKPASEKEILKEWVIVLLESMGVGAVAVILLLAAVLLAVGIYVQIVWPLTDWDLVGVSLESYQSAANAVLTGVFIGGFLAGYWCISGHAWKKLPGPSGILPRVPVRSRR